LSVMWVPPSGHDLPPIDSQDASLESRRRRDIIVIGPQVMIASAQSIVHRGPAAKSAPQGS